MSTTNPNRIHNDIPICQETPISPIDLAALSVAARQFDRATIEPGEYKIWTRLLIHGRISVAEPYSAAGPPDYQGVLAWILARMRPEAVAMVADAIAAGSLSMLDKEQRERAKAVASPTQRTTVRNGALKGIVEIVPTVEIEQ